MQPILELFISGNTSGSTPTISRNGGQLDMYGNEQINLTYEIKNVNDFTSIASSHSQAFTLPGTKNNNALLGYIFEIGSDSSFDPRKKAGAYLLCDSINIMEGYLQLNAISTSDLGEIIYNVVLFTDTGDLFSKIQGKYLTDMDFSSLTHILSEPTVVGSWFNPFINNYYYGLIDYGSNWNMAQQVGNTIGMRIPISNIYPHLYTKYIWDKIFQDAGKTYTSNFLVSSAFTQTIIPFNSNKDQINTPDFITGKTFWSRYSADTVNLGSNFQVVNANQVFTTVAFQNSDTTTAPYFDNGGSITNATGIYTSTAPAVQQFSTTVYCEIDPNVTSIGEFSIHVEFFRSNFTGAFYTGVKTFTSNLFGLKNEVFTTPILNDISLGSNQQPIQTGEIVQCRIKYVFNTNGPAAIFVLNNFTDPIIYTYAINTHWHNTVGLDWLSGQTVNFNQFVPQKIKQVDFVKSITTMFNLWIEPQKSNVNNLIIDTRSNYFSSGITLNWTNKIDLNKPVTQDILAEQKSKKYTFTYKQDSDAYNSIYESSTNQIFGQYIYDFDNDFLVDNQNIDCIFSPSPLGEIDGSNNQILLPGIFKVDSSNNHQRTDSNIRLLARKNTAITDGRVFGFYQASAYTYYPYVGHVDNFFTGQTDYNWGPVEYEYFNPITNNGITNNNLYNVYWKQYVDAIGSKNSRFVTAYFYLTPSDIANFRFCDQIFCDGLSDDGGHFFIVNKIEYSPTVVDSYKVELIKLDSVDSSYPSTVPPTNTGGGGIGPVNNNRISLGGNNNPALPGTIIGGGNNFISSLSLVQGEMNIIEGGSNAAIIQGDGNTIGAGSPGSLMLGNYNTAQTQTRSSMISGDFNYITEFGESTTIFGDNNNILPLPVPSPIFLVPSSNNFVKGYENDIYTQNNIVYGSGNTISGVTNNLFNVYNTIIPQNINNVTAFNVSGGSFSASNTVYVTNLNIASGLTFPPGYILTGVTSNNDFSLTGIITPRITGDTSGNLLIGGTTNNLNNSTNSTLVGGTGNLLELSINAFAVGGENIRLSTGSTNSAIIGGSGGTINMSPNSIVLGGSGNILSSSPLTSMLGGSGNTINFSVASSIIGATGATINGSPYTSIITSRQSNIESSPNSIVLGGSSNGITGGTSSIIIGGQTNQTASATTSFMIGVESGSIFGPSSYSSILNSLTSQITTSDYSTIIGGDSSLITSSLYSTILGGNSQDINTSVNSVIIGGASNIITSGTNVVMLGTSGLTNSGLSNTIFMPSIWVQSASTIYIQTGITAALGSPGDPSGNVQLTLGVATVNNSLITASSVIILTAQDNNSVGTLRISSRTPGLTFTITSTNLADSGVVGYLIIEPF